MAGRSGLGILAARSCVSLLGLCLSRLLSQEPELGVLEIMEVYLSWFWRLRKSKVRVPRDSVSGEGLSLNPSITRALSSFVSEGDRWQIKTDERIQSSLLKDAGRKSPCLSQLCYNLGVGGIKIKVHLPSRLDALHEETQQKCYAKLSTSKKAAPSQTISSRAALSSRNRT